MKNSNLNKMQTLEKNILRSSNGCAIFYVIPQVPNDKKRLQSSSIYVKNNYMNQSQNVQFILKSVDNLMSKDEHKVWLSTKRGELKIYKEFQSENLDPNMSYIEVE
jgi:hypothetical protein